MVWFGEFEQEDAGGKVVDVGEAEGDELGGEFVGDDLHVEGGEALFHRRGGREESRLGGEGGCGRGRGCLRSQITGLLRFRLCSYVTMRLLQSAPLCMHFGPIGKGTRHNKWIWNEGNEEQIIVMLRSTSMSRVLFATDR